MEHIEPLSSSNCINFPKLLYSLPDELLLDVAACLDPADLQSFTHVSARLRRIGQDILHHEIKLSQPEYHSAPSHVPLLVRTLIERPDLANKIRHLSVTVVDRRVGFKRPKKFLDAVERALQDVDLFTTLWMSQIKARWEPAFCGLLLALVPSLQSLDIAVISANFQQRDDLPGIGDNPYVDYPSQHLFCQQEENSNFHIATVPGLHALKTLCFRGRNREPDWCRLPLLYSLELSRECNFTREPPPSFHASNITELELQCATYVFSVDGGYYNYLPQLLKSFKRLQHLTLLFDDNRNRRGYDELEYPDSILEHDGIDGSYATVIRRLEPVETALETLILDLDDSYWPAFLERVAHLPPLLQFTNLKTLTIPYGALPRDTNRAETGVHHGRLPPSAIFPPSMKVLSILNPNNLTYKWLEDLSDSRKALPFLRTVKVYFRQEWCMNYRERWLVEEDQSEDAHQTPDWRIEADIRIKQILEMMTEVGEKFRRADINFGIFYSAQDTTTITRARRD